MSTTRIDGGSAFPVSDPQGAMPRTTDEMKQMARGMSLRDYFAAQALSGLIGTYSTQAHARLALSAVAEDAYTIADAMLAARGA